MGVSRSFVRSRVPARVCARVVRSLLRTAVRSLLISISYINLLCTFDTLGFWPAVVYKPKEIRDVITKNAAIAKRETHQLVVFISPKRVQWFV